MVSSGRRRSESHTPRREAIEELHIEAAAEPMIGRTLGHFRITAKLGEGGMGAVYRAKDLTLGREVAVKVLPEPFAADRQRMARFEREARVLASLSHPRIAGVHEVGQEGNLHYLVMELAPGETLADRIARGPLPVAEALAISAQIAEALSAAHARGVVHRDLKPANVQLGPDGEVKVLDFGLAKAVDLVKYAAEAPERQLVYVPNWAAELEQVLAQRGG